GDVAVLYIDTKVCMGGGKRRSAVRAGIASQGQDLSFESAPITYKPDAQIGGAATATHRYRVQSWSQEASIYLGLHP
ncbi:MAG: hypothetical protein ACYCV7_13605, partial [Acidimicrobiales bacterium]